ncbi:MAG TPA: isoprenylcysteine carboxylmethyltransferase family protein [Candidatus Binatia bacterium]|jgi:protein-S-isoprenylcysteine O-methyltransferase Ste14|nr:isoprenylcysteine carboxylmethyltransferase family protein [Candidatus Binatia bacterium]
MDNLKAKILFRSAMLPVTLGIILFLTAGTFAYWQAWVYCLVFFVAVMLIGAYFLKNDPALLERRLKIGETGETEPKQKIIQTVAGALYFASFLIPGLDRRLHWSAVPASLVLAADVGVALAFLIVFFVFRENSYTSSIIEVDESQRVIETGPYRVVRHPMYAGALLLFLAAPLALGSFWALLFVVPLSTMVVLRLIDEERFLSEHLPGYTAYCQKTRYRLVPLIW